MPSSIEVESPISLQCRFSYLFVSGACSTLELVVTSRTAAPIEDLHINFVSNAFSGGRVRWRAEHELQPWGTSGTQVLSARAGHYGNHPVKLEVSLRQGRHRLTGRAQVLPLGQPALVVLSEPRSVQSLVIEIKERAFFGAILEGVDLAKVQHVNDLLGRQITQQFDPISVRFEASNTREDKAVAAIPPHDPTWPTALGRWLPIPGMECLLMSTPVPQGLWKEVMEEPWAEYYARVAEDRSELPPELCGDSMPVAGITFAEALEFCDAYQCYCHAAGLLPEGWTIRLPLPAEWKKARGTVPPAQDLTRYCHNHGLCRHTQSRRLARPRSLKEMTAAKYGIHPLPSGFYGMLGDLFEWCLPSHSNGEGLPSHSVLLGGSWKHADRAFCTGESMNRQPVHKRSRRFGLRLFATCERPWHDGL